MKIDIAKNARMALAGTGLLRMIPTDEMPILDLFVRESVQNSLDASKSDSKYVRVDFICSNFAANRLHQELEGITEKLNSKFPDTTYEYLAIQDRNTEGLTGPLESVGDSYGNLQKLVYEISKAQSAEGAGGSWGYGKTIYFRLGIGLVLYYSRIMTDAERYEERLAVALVEDETKPDALLPKSENMNNRGIAWWGKISGKDSDMTIPITDADEIKRILDIFGLKPYADDETGTTIIIPYINTGYLLNHNYIQRTDCNGQEILKPYWLYNIDEYLSIALQRWYAPRIDNRQYDQGAWLKPFVNNKEITSTEMEPIFQIIQSLYKMAQGVSKEKNPLQSNPNAHKMDISLNNVHLQQNLAGRVAAVKITEAELKMLPPNNKLDPYQYLNIDQPTGDGNPPIIMFTRKPAMIVNYQTDGSWTKSIDSTRKGEFLIGFFVLSSTNKMKNINKEMTLEEYMRQGEHADHRSWFDTQINGARPNILVKIQQNLTRKIANEYNIKQGPVNERPLGLSGLGQHYGGIFLPPQGFGKRSSVAGGRKSPPRSTDIGSQKGLKLSLDRNKIEYTAEGIEIPLRIESNKMLHGAEISVDIASESGAIMANDWTKNTGLPLPIEVSSVSMTVARIDGIAMNSQGKIGGWVKHTSIKNIDFSFLYTTEGKAFGMKLYTEKPKKFIVDVRIRIAVHNREVQLHYRLKQLEEDE